MLRSLAPAVGLLVIVAACNAAPQGTSDQAPPATPTTEAEVARPEPPTAKEAPTSDERAREPVVLELEGWPPSEDSREGDHRLLVYDGKEPDCSVRVDRWWGMPPTPGGPMEIASKRPVHVDGRDLELIRTKAFEGVAREVDVLFHSGDGFQVRVVFSGCRDETVDKVLDLTRVLR